MNEQEDVVNKEKKEKKGMKRSRVREYIKMCSLFLNYWCLAVLLKPRKGHKYILTLYTVSTGLN